MAVSSKTAHDPVPNRPPAPAQGPIRTCIGCRRRASAAELLRVVAVAHGESITVIADPRRRAPGRGAWLHRDPGCVDLAERRRAFGRALRVAGPLDPAPIREYVDHLEPQQPTSGIPQE